MSNRKNNYDKKGLLSEHEKKALKSMANYWMEVNEREDKTPLHDELIYLFNRLGIKLLFIVDHYLYLTEEV